MITSFWEVDHYGYIGAIGLVGLSFSNNEFLGLFLLLTPASAIVDCVRMGVAGKFNVKALWILLDIFELIGKAFATFIAYNVI